MAIVIVLRAMPVHGVTNVRTASGARGTGPVCVSLHICVLIENIFWSPNLLAAMLELTGPPRWCSINKVAACGPVSISDYFPLRLSIAARQPAFRSENVVNA